ncbi:MAG: DUF2169 domain-containing protein, partial [Rhodothermales bacterium]|nr:DUF2169 domain-containing protein [Rhodothermales bacterium]
LAIKGTFSIPKKAGEQPRLLEEQVPLVEADTFSGEPGLSSPLFEVDYAPVKNKCDITLVGSAYAPAGRATESVQAGFKVGNLSKVLNVHGDRFWVASHAGFAPSRALPFEQRAITYDIAFGGVDRFHEDESRHDPYMLNPVGIGYHKELSDALVDNTPAPCTEECDKPILKPDGQYKPMSFGPVGRGWLPRYKLGGTYDENWLEDHFPFLPPDFDEHYYQSAPVDQQTPHLKGGERVALLNVTEDGKRVFQLPKIDIPVVFFKKKSEREEQLANLDTLVLDPDNHRFTMTWRASVKLRNDMYEVPEVLVGKATRGWWRARDLGKTYYPSIEALIRSKRTDALEDES